MVKGIKRLPKLIRECPNCGARHKWPALGVELVQFDNGTRELWCSPCRYALAPEETALYVRSSFAGTPADKRKARAAMAKMEKRVRGFIAAREWPA
jgi:hypothetical protein